MNVIKHRRKRTHLASSVGIALFATVYAGCTAPGTYLERMVMHDGQWMLAADVYAHPPNESPKLILRKGAVTVTRSGRDGLSFNAGELLIPSNDMRQCGHERSAEWVNAPPRVASDAVRQSLSHALRDDEDGLKTAKSAPGASRALVALNAKSWSDGDYDILEKGGEILILESVTHTLLAVVDIHSEKFVPGLAEKCSKKLIDGPSTACKSNYNPYFLAATPVENKLVCFRIVPKIDKSGDGLKDFLVITAYSQDEELPYAGAPGGSGAVAGGSRPLTLRTSDPRKRVE
jgi:hypothetical protein